MPSKNTESIRIDASLKAKLQEYGNKCRPRADLKAVIEHALEEYLNYHEPAVSVRETAAHYVTKKDKIS